MVFWYSNIRGKKYSNIRTIRILSAHYIIYTKELIFGVWYTLRKINELEVIYLYKIL